MTCRNCGVSLEAMAPTARYCSTRCRSAYRRQAPAEVQLAAGQVADAVAGEFARLGQSDTALAAMAQRLAVQLDSPTTPPGALASIAKQLAALLLDAREVDGEVPRYDYVDHLRDKARERIAQAKAAAR